VIVWDDRRDEGRGEGSHLYGQRLGRDGDLLGSNVLLTPDESGTEFPAVALGERRVGLVYTVFGSPPRLRFRALEADLDPSASSAPFGDNADSPSVHPLADGFVVVWEVAGQGVPGNALYGAVFDDAAQLLVEPTLLATGTTYLRSHSVLSFGDRLLVTWADDSSGSYDLHWQFFGADLAALTTRAVLTTGDADALSPSLAVSAEGTIGVAFDDFRDGSRQVYFTTFACD
jgi:hypothetical protein